MSSGYFVYGFGVLILIIPPYEGTTACICNTIAIVTMTIYTIGILTENKNGKT